MSVASTSLVYQERLFNFFIFVTYLFYISMFIGISFINPDLFWYIDYYVKLYVAIFLIIRYNPFFKTQKFTPLDKKLSFHAGVFIFTTLALKSIVVYLQKSDPTWTHMSSYGSLPIGLCSDNDNQSTSE